MDNEPSCIIFTQNTTNLPITTPIPSDYPDNPHLYQYLITTSRKGGTYSDWMVYLLISYLLSIYKPKVKKN